MDGKTAMAGAARLFPDAVRGVSKWALINASLCAFALVYALMCKLVEFELTGAEEAVEYLVEIGTAPALQAAAAVQSRRLPCRYRRIRRALAYLVLALTIVAHCVNAHEGHLFLVAHPGDLFFRISFAGYIIVFAVGDLLGFLALLLGGDGDGEELE